MARYTASGVVKCRISYLHRNRDTRNDVRTILEASLPTPCCAVARVSKPPPVLVNEVKSMQAREMARQVTASLRAEVTATKLSHHVGKA